MNNLTLKTITKESFAPFGDVIEVNRQSKETFQVILAEEDVAGWRIAVSNLSGRGIVKKLGSHPNTRESFEPMNGIAVIIVAEKDSPEVIHAFLLDKPICLHKYVWHATLALSEIAELKITENASNIESLHHTLDQPVSIGLIQV
ncbi:ureidoglycolate lyase [Bacillus solitudinis]|uniref:ureidoglycolate lyase n=1 Tax=Bacillus solitudinis TaxID=2014074 RepID=UPI000C247145|nr:ureidoglycolate lyase [Bacillus solitudinis]